MPSTPETLYVTITNEDIALGGLDRNNLCSTCPVARAFTREHKVPVWVTGPQVLIAWDGVDNEDHATTYATSQEAYDWIAAFDRRGGEAVKPTRLALCTI